jgi:hypothetical protein
MPSAWSLTRVEQEFPEATGAERFRMADLVDEAMKQGAEEEWARWMLALDPEVSTIQKRIRDRREGSILQPICLSRLVAFLHPGDRSC